MGLNMGNADYARSQLGVKALQALVDSDFELIRKSMKGSEYNQLIRDIKNNWVGEDADSFIKALNIKITNIDSRLFLMKDKIKNSIQQEYSEFLKFQQRNKMM